MALGFGLVGVASAFVSRRHPSLKALILGAWAAALLTFGSACSRRRLALPPAAVASGIAAGTLAVLATRAWELAPLALAASTASAHLLRVRWTVLLTIATVSLAAAAAVQPFGRPGASDALAALAYGLACVACCTAAASRMRA